MNQMADRPGQAQTEFYGKYRGQVVDNTDPQSKGRLLITVPQVLNEVPVWAEPCVPYAGRNIGFYAMPEIGGGVWIEFEAGDPSYPIWTGCFWADGDIPSEDADPSIKFFRMNKATIRIDDSNGEILIENDSGHSITMTTSEITIKSNTVKQEASGSKVTELSASSFKVNNGNLEVL
ncbi:phage baseplate assembly protein V [Tateyamaria armeniaca]|uniref:Phage baseplate assembly protein V n=1 Tax=Tateyamaria armeniaca TaxID=2518930 RepID=A0ABW8USJ5_9RHOB